MPGTLVETIFDSSIMEESVETRYLFICLLAISTPDGVVDRTPQAIARRVNLTVEAVNRALAVLTSEDANSRSPEHEGRRLVPLEDREWGWRIVNKAKYSEPPKASDRKLYMRHYMRDKREEKRVSDAMLTPLTAETGDSISSSELENRKKSCVAVDGFETFWAAYPRKRSKPDAEKAWKQTAKHRPDLSALLLALERQKQAWHDPQFIPYPATWLRRHEWGDEPDTVTKNGNGKHANQKPDIPGLRLDTDGRLGELRKQGRIDPGRYDSLLTKSHAAKTPEEFQAVLREAEA